MNGEQNMDEKKKAFWNMVTLQEKSEADMISAAKNILACAAKNKCEPSAEMQWMMNQKSMAKTASGKRKQLERMIKLFETREYDKSRESSDCVTKKCPKQSEAFFNAQMQSLIAQSRAAIARIELLEAAKKERDAKTKTKKN